MWFVKSMPGPMPKPVTTVELIRPVWSCCEPSSKMFSTLTCCDSGGWMPMPNGRAFVSAGSITGICSAVWSLPGSAPSTDSGPRMAESRCGTFGNSSRFALPVATL